MDADKVLEHPASRGVLDRLPLLVGKRGLVGLEGVPDAVLQRRIHEQVYGHDHQKRHDPLRFLQIERRGQKEGIF